MTLRAADLRRRLGTMFEQAAQLEPAGLTTLRRFLYRQVRFLYIVGRGTAENQVTLQASALTFSMLLSLVPFLAVAFSLLKALGMQNRLEPLLTRALAPLGPGGAEIAGRLMQLVDNLDVGALGAVGSLALLVTVVSLMGNVEQAFNRIWGVRTPRRLARKFADYLSVLLVGPVLVVAALGILASLQSLRLVQHLMAIEPFGTSIVLALRLLPYLLLWAAFTCLYIFMPNTAVSLGPAAVGGAVAAALWVGAGWGFATFVASSTRYAAIYSGLAILLLFLLWCYVAWVVVLLGAQVAFARQHAATQTAGWQACTRSVAERERLGLQIMLLVGQRFLAAGPPWTAEELARRLNVPAGLVSELLEVFAQKGLLTALRDSGSYLPGRDLERIGIKEILDSLRTDGQIPPPQRASEPRQIADELLEAVDRAVTAAIGDKSLRAVLLEAAPPDHTAE